MSEDDFNLGSFTVTSTRGGARPGAGRKPAGYVKPDEVVSFDKAKARKETALADLHELEFKVKSGQYVSRASVKQASATALAHLAQSIRSIPDTLERKGVPVATCALIEEVITATLAEAGKSLAKLYSAAGEAVEPAEPNSDLF